MKQAPYSPWLNAYAERFVQPIKTECFDNLMPIGEDSLRRAVNQFVEHYNSERPHQVFGNDLIEFQKTAASPDK